MDDPQLVVDYVNEIYEYMRMMERSQAIKKDYLHGKIGKKVNIVEILITWLSWWKSMSCSFESRLLRWDVEINPDNSENKLLKTCYYLAKESYPHIWCLFPGAILPKMRSVLIEWLVEVHQQFSLLQETLYLSVAILDRFMQVSFNLDSHTSWKVTLLSLSVVHKKLSKMVS